MVNWAKNTGFKGFLGGNSDEMRQSGRQEFLKLASLSSGLFDFFECRKGFGDIELVVSKYFTAATLSRKMIGQAV